MLFIDLKLIWLYHPLCRKASVDSKKTKIFKSLNIKDIQNAWHRNCPN